ncbi:MAG: hypothetical protein WCJ09_06095 [Planctomycetota bacterium]
MRLMHLICVVVVVLSIGCASKEVRERRHIKKSIGFLIENHSEHDLDPESARWEIEQVDGDDSTEKWSFRDKKTGEWFDYRIRIHRIDDGTYSYTGFEELEKASPDEVRQVSDRR